MSSSPACLDEKIDWERSQVFTYCGNCKGIRDLMEKHNELKRSYESALKLNELLVQKIAALERRRPEQEEQLSLSTPYWDENEERAAFQQFMSNISKTQEFSSSDYCDRGEPRLRDINPPSYLYESHN